MKNNKERRSVDLFSDYGLDERQKSISAKLGADMFKALFNAVVAITVIWAAVYGAVPDLGIHFRFVMASYFGAAIIIRCVYAVKAANAGIINGITAFSFTTGSLLSAGICAAAGIVMILLNSLIPFDGMFFGIMLIAAAAENIVLYLCGKKNFSVIDEKGSEE
ncbi:MAG: hypothetical protein ACI4Q6_01580 [Huintestinicola sp.]